MIRSALLIFSILLFANFASAQADSAMYYPLSDSANIDSIYRRKIIAWATPSKADEIDGVSFCYFIAPYNNTQGWMSGNECVHINGMNIQVFPLAFIFAPYVLSMPTFGVDHYGNVKGYKEFNQKQPEAIINGLNISQNQIGSVHIHGVSINAACSVIDEVHGISIDGLTHYSHVMHGLSIATMRNVSDEMRGVQIGIYNKSVDLRGFQFGLWNVNGKRKLPIINWQFSK